MKFKSIFAALAIAALACSCSSDDSATTTSTTSSAGILFATAVTNPEGNSAQCYLQTLGDLTAQSIDNKNGVPMGYGASPIVTPSGNIYAFPDYMAQIKSVVTRYTLGAKGELVKQGELAIPAGAMAANIVEVNSTKAYISMQGLGIVMAFNPTTMTKTAEIDLNSLRQEGTNVSPAAMVVRDDQLFVGLNQMNANWMPQKNNIELALIDTKTDKLVKHIVNTTHGFSFATRPIDPNSIFVDENKDIYFNCVGSFGMMADFPGGIVRIKAGATDIDPDYRLPLTTTEVKGLSVKYADYLLKLCYAGNGKLYAIANANAVDPTAANNPYMSMTCFPVVIDLKTKTIEKIEGAEYSNPQCLSLAMHKGLVVFGSANAKANAFYTYNPTTRKVEGPILQVQGFPLFIHSFLK